MKTVFYYIVSILVEVVAFITALFLLFFDLEKRNPMEKSDKTPILLIHGYFLNSGVWWYMRSKLIKAGYCVYTINLGSSFPSIDIHAQKVKKMAEEIERLSGRRDLVIIGHSMGGVVGLHYAYRYAKPNSVTDLITLGSPLEGTKMANLGSSQSAKEMRIGSSFLQESQKAVLPMRFFHIATRVDTAIIPWQSELFYSNRGPHIQRYTYECMSHIQFVFSGRVAKQIIEYLRK